VTVYPIIAATNSSTVLPQGAKDLLDGEQENIWLTSWDGNNTYYLGGGAKGWPGIQDCIILSQTSDLSPDFKHIDLKSARQPGVTYTGSLFDTLNIDFDIELHATTPQGISRLMSGWMGAWHPTKKNTLEYWTTDRGYWYCKPRLAKRWGNKWKQTPRTLRMVNLTHSMRVDLPFWLGVPSIDSFSVGGGRSSASGWIQLGNIGTEDGWPTILFYGPGTFEFGNGPGSTSMLSLGPLLDGQVVMMPTLPRLNNIIDLTSGIPQSLSVQQQALVTLINFVTNNNVPPLLTQLESAFGILPPQGNLAGLLTGRYDNPIPGVSMPEFAQLQSIPVTISGTGGSSASKIVMRIDPMRTWPE
jgi:hypothetical protein